jgi:hypothetical protein
MTVVMKTARILAPLVLTAAVPGLMQLPAAAVTRHVGGPVAVSGRSPFPLGCTGAGRGFAHGAAVEPSLAVDPADPADLAGMWQQDRATTGPGGSQGNVAAFSRDGGRSWHEVVPPGVSRCSGGTYQLASDPWLSFSANGKTLYAASLAIDAVKPPNGVLVSTSFNGGRTWHRPVTVIGDTKAVFIDDKEAVTADPANPSEAYVVWDRQDMTRHGGQPAWFATTTNRGRTWSKPKIIYDPTALGGSTEGNIITVLPDGTLVDVFLYAAIGLIPPDGPNVPGTPAARAARRVPTEIRAVISRNKGRTWSRPVIVARIGYRDHGFAPGTGHRIRTGGNIPAVATNPRTGQIYVTWAGARLSRSRSAIGIVSSSDGGRTWTKPLRINKTPPSGPHGDGQAFTPGLSVTADGTVAVTYYDLRLDTSAPGLPTERWAVTCRGPACTRRARAWTEQPVLGPFNLKRAPLISKEGYFLGDYMGQAAAGNTVLALTTATTAIPGNQQNEYFQRITSRR